MSAWREDARGLTVEVQVMPRASRERLGPVVDGGDGGERLKVHLTAPPVDGAANEALIALMARALGVPRARVRLVRGERGRRKTIHVDGLETGVGPARLSSLLMEAKEKQEEHR